MKTMEIRFTVSESILETLNRTKETFVQQMRLLFAVHLFSQKELTFGQAMELAEVNRDMFLRELDRQKIPVINYEGHELEAELKLFSL